MRQGKANKTVMALAAALALSAGSALADEHPNFTGLWQVEHFTPALKTTDGKRPPLKPEALALYNKRVADRAAGKSVNDPLDACLPHGSVRLMFAPYPMVIVQTPGEVDVVQTANHTQRWFYIDQPQVELGDTKWMGHSIAHWDGKALVVETVNNDGRTWLDKAGLPHSDDMKLTERLTLGAGGKTLTDVMTIDDPATYTAPWSTQVRFKRKPGSMTLTDNVCTRDHRM